MFEECVNIKRYKPFLYYDIHVMEFLEYSL